MGVRTSTCSASGNRARGRALVVSRDVGKGHRVRNSFVGHLALSFSIKKIGWAIATKGSLLSTTVLFSILVPSLTLPRIESRETVESRTRERDSASSYCRKYAFSNGSDTHYYHCANCYVFVHQARRMQLGSRRSVSKSMARLSE